MSKSRSRKPGKCFNCRYGKKNFKTLRKGKTDRPTNKKKKKLIFDAILVLRK